MRWVGAFLLVLPGLLAVATDALRRGTRLWNFEPTYKLTYFAAWVESLIVWSALLYAASRRSGWGRWVAAVLFVVFSTFAFGGQQYFYEQYHAYLNVDVSVFASNLMDSVVNQLFADIGNYAKAKLPPFVLSIALVWAARRTVNPTHKKARVVTVLAPIVLVAAFFIPTQHRHLQAATPDMLYLNAIGGLIRTQLGFTDQSHQLRPKPRNSLPVPKLTRASTPPRNVLFIILESVRRDAVCVEYEPGCKLTEATNELLPNRHPLTQMRSMDSCTAISLAVLWSGVRPVEDREVLHTWPLIFDYAKAAGYDTAFWTSQNMMFGNARLWVKNLGVHKFCSATDLYGTSDLDMGAPEMFLARRVNREIGTLHEPFLAVIQTSNVHYPYYVVRDGPKPFQPASLDKSPDKNLVFRNFYQNSVYQEDQHVADMIKNLRSTEAGKRTVIVYTSDHAEAFREHYQMGHTFTTYDEEIHVPAWIDAPEGTLTDAERAALESKARQYVFHVDMAPTVLDLMGVLDDPGIARYRTKMAGHSLIRPELTTEALPMTNCAGVWSCAFENWGYMQRNMKITARGWDTNWKCFDVAADPKEQHDLGADACGDLPRLAMKTFGRLPGRDHEAK